jgi:hypothetical protein
MKLSVGDRLNILNKMFPSEGNFIELRLMKGIREKIDFEAKEIGLINFEMKPIGNNLVGFDWDKKKAKILDIKFETAEIDFLQGRVKLLDDQKKIPEECFDLFEAINNEK